MKKLTTAEFIERARAVHGNRYDYSKVKYVGSHQRVKIVCPDHGTFMQSPTTHLKGSGCRKCAFRPKMSTLKFVERATKAHHGLYDYSKTEYAGADRKVTITCPLHGDYQKRAIDHLRGQGCPTCGYIRTSTSQHMGNDAFVKKAKKLHKNFYDYSHVEYVNTKTPVTIICPEHGQFEQRPDVHLRGFGCPVCRYIKVGKANAMTREEFIRRANLIFDSYYDYSAVQYKNGETPVTIICPIHGPFEKKPVHHIHCKVGCPKCLHERMQTLFRKTTEKFIEEARLIHSDRYDYSQVDYQTAFDSVIIVCPEHGLFKQRPSDHLKGIGCRECGYQRNSQLFRMSQDEFIERCKKTHSEKYDYSEVDYQGGDKKIRIICPEHGPFEQLAYDHMVGRGCASCQEYGFQPARPATLYYLRVETSAGIMWKIGITNRAVEDRFAGRDIKKIHIIKTWAFDVGMDAIDREQEILNEYCVDLYSGTEKLLESGNTELFTRDVLGLDTQIK